MTAEESFNNRLLKPRILVAPLEWGLGHATRCIPIIRQLISLDCEVIIAAEAAGKLLLTKEFPALQFVELKGYRMQYSRSKAMLPVKILTQFPKICYSIFSEHKWLSRIIEDERIDAVISDNRFGMYSNKVPCVYITHQLQIKTGNQITDTIAKKIHGWFIKKYNACWIPDFEKAPGIAGELSHISKMPSNSFYIGCLSRFKKKIPVEKTYDLLCSISGPEPQRTLFEEIILAELKLFNGEVLIVRGLPGSDSTLKGLPSNVKFCNHLESEAFEQALLSSKLVLSRSGYTSIMDYLQLGSKAILVPTPGQKEQEYLADFLSSAGLFATCRQNRFNLQRLVEESAKLKALPEQLDMQSFKKTVSEFVDSLR